MRTPLTVLAAASASVLASGLLAAVGTAASAAPSSGPTEDQPTSSWIVVLRDSAAPNAVAAEHSRRYDAQVGHVYEHALKGYSARMSATAAARLTDDPRVLFVQPDGIVHATAPKGDKPGKGKPTPEEPPVEPPAEEPVSTQSLPTGINRAEADLSPTAAINAPGTGDFVPSLPVAVDVAVIDTGVDLDHPDLNVYTAGAKDCVSRRGTADDGNGHGTHVAGTIGALDNTLGVVGMAPGARIWPVRVLNNQGSGTFSGIICGIDYVTANADSIEVANMSLGGSGTDDGSCGELNGDGMHRAICGSVDAGITYVVAAGNDADDAARHVPAAYDEVITVSALADFNGLPGGGAAATCRSDVDDSFANFSNYGADVDLIAPGVCIASTWMRGGYNTISGTSMASPHVAGGAALYLVKNASASPAGVKSALQSAGSTDWDADDDPDRTQEPLLDVGGF